MKTALIMEGGAMRGMFTCGVTDVLMENGITFDGAAGISAGAVFGCNFKSGQIGRPIRYNKKYCRDPRYCSFRSWIRTGDLYGADFCYRVLPDELDPFDRETFSRNPMAFYVGATEVETGKCVFHRCTDSGETDMLWLRASASMPMVSRPVRIGDRSYLDGGIADAVPYAYMEQLGYDRNVIVLTQPKGYRKPPAGGPGMRFFLRRMPKIMEAMVHRHEMYNRQMEEIDRKEAERPPWSSGLRKHCGSGIRKRIRRSWNAYTGSGGGKRRSVCRRSGNGWDPDPETGEGESGVQAGCGNGRGREDAFGYENGGVAE